MACAETEKMVCIDHLRAHWHIRMGIEALAALRPAGASGGILE
jgi:hypothetical protein